MSPTKCTCPLAHITITYYYLIHVLALGHHQEEPSARDSTYRTPVSSLESAVSTCIRQNSK